MSEGNVEIVRSYFEAIGRRDMDALVQSLPADFELDFSRSRGPESGIYRGPERVRQLVQALTEAFSDFEPFETEMIDGDDVLVRVGGFRTRGEASGIEVVAKAATVWRFREGRPISATLFQDKAQALKAAGLSE
jgi:ketosteroid isomerase-like protein